MSQAIPLLVADSLGRQAADGRWLLRHVSLTLVPGERVAVLGPTGAGKSLLLRAIARLDPIQEGQLLWRGQAVAGRQVPAYRARAIYLRQRPAPCEGTVEEILRSPLEFAIHREKAFDRDRLAVWLGKSDRDESFLDKQCRDLSGGEAQIAALLAAMQLDPELLILDEPTAALDAGSAMAVEELVGQWMAEPAFDRACLWVTHNRQQAERVSDRRIHLQDGHIMLGV